MTASATVDTPTTYADLVGKKVELTYRAGGDTVTETGTVKVANSTGVMFQRGQKTTLILNHEIENSVIVGGNGRAAAVPAAPAEITAKRLNPITENTVKRHLALNHAVLLGAVNRLSVADAMELHALQHENAGDECPHYHAEKPAE